MSDSLRPNNSQHARPLCPSTSPRVHSDSHPSSPWCHPAISSSVIPFSSSLQSFPASGSFPMTQFFRWPKYWSFSFSISPSNEYSGQLVWSACSPRDSQEASPAPQFVNISSSALSLLYGPTLTSVHLYPFFGVCYWKNHSFDYMDLCQKSYVSALFAI